MPRADRATSPTRTLIWTAAAALTVSCSGVPTPDVADVDAVDDAPSTAAADLAPRCEGLEDVPLDPPADRQPEADASITTAAPIDDLDVGDGGGADDLHADSFHPADQGAGLEQARRWAERAAGEHFAGMWLEPRHDAVVFAFTDEVETYAAELRERFGDGLWVTRLEHGRSELDALQSRISADELPPTADGDGIEPGAVIGIGQRDPSNRVLVTVFELTDDRHAELSDRYGADLICVEDGEPMQRGPAPATDPEGWDGTDGP